MDCSDPFDEAPQGRSLVRFARVQLSQEPEATTGGQRLLTKCLQDTHFARKEFQAIVEKALKDRLAPIWHRSNSRLMELRGKRPSHSLPENEHTMAFPALPS